MFTSQITRRDFSTSLASLIAFGSLAKRSLIASPDEVSHTAESIHQEIVFTTSRHRLYQALTDPQHFGNVMRLGSMPKAAAPQIAKQAGGTFVLFDGHILGRHIELLPDVRLVQAWRVIDWPTGLYSVARFEFKEEGARTRIVFDHTGFPLGQGEHLADGWHTNYWKPLRQYVE